MSFMSWLRAASPPGLGIQSVPGKVNPLIANPVLIPLGEAVRGNLFSLPFPSLLPPGGAGVQVFRTLLCLGRLFTVALGEKLPNLSPGPAESSPLCPCAHRCSMLAGTQVPERMRRKPCPKGSGAPPQAVSPRGSSTSGCEPSPPPLALLEPTGQ